MLIPSEHTQNAGQRTSDTQKQISCNNNISFVILSHIYPIIFGGTRSHIDRLINEIESCSPDILILPGDIIEGTWNTRNWAPYTFHSDQSLRDFLNNQWDTVFAIFIKLNIPIWIAPGNHDISSYNVTYRDIAREVFITRVGRPYHAKRFGNYGFLFLNTCISDSTGAKYGLDQTQIRWLKDQLMSASYKATFLFLHHPIWYGGLQTHPGNVIMEPSNWMKEVHPLLPGNVNYVFAGDGGDRRNFLFYEIRDDIHYYVNGSGRIGVTFLHVQTNNEAIKISPHFLDIRSSGPEKTGKDDNIAGKYSTNVLLALHSKLFWAGVLASYLVLGAIIAILKRSGRWFHGG